MILDGILSGYVILRAAEVPEVERTGHESSKLKFISKLEILMISIPGKRNLNFERDFFRGFI